MKWLKNLFGERLNSKNLERLGFKYVPREPFTGVPVWVKGKYDIPGLGQQGDRITYIPTKGSVLYLGNTTFYNVHTLDDIQKIVDMDSKYSERVDKELAKYKIKRK